MGFLLPGNLYVMLNTHFVGSVMPGTVTDISRWVKKAVPAIKAYNEQGTYSTQNYTTGYSLKRQRFVVSKGDEDSYMDKRQKELVRSLDEQFHTIKNLKRTAFPLCSDEGKVCCTQNREIQIHRTHHPRTRLLPRRWFQSHTDRWHWRSLLSSLQF